MITLVVQMIVLINKKDLDSVIFLSNCPDLIPQQTFMCECIIEKIFKATETI